MPILGTDAYRLALAFSLSSAQTSLSLISAYMTTAGVTWVLERLNPAVSSCRAMARWGCGDLVSGSSDLDVYELLRDKGWRFFMLPDLHAKVVLVDGLDLFVSSANITGAGLRLVPGGNREIGVKGAASADDVAIIDAMFDEATEITPDLFEEIRGVVERFRRDAKPRVWERWPTELLKKLEKGPSRLWVGELLWCSPDELRGAAPGGTDGRADLRHDLALLGLDLESYPSLSVEALETSFLTSRAWRWLIVRLNEAEDGELYFGRLTEILHNSLLDDPRPYRQDLKRLIANLLGWAADFGRGVVTVDRPNYSQRVRLIR
ncbi:MAG TPA: hypothetical protein VNZ44_01335, partial [Pyrinomonadaceae bacterium]|nr:hypothetical protein [Pyrinomonadaceae bacterium]